MTDKEIIECAENCIRENPSCISCPFDEGTYTADECMGKLIAKLVDVNNRQKAEIDGLIAGQESLQKHLAEKNAEIESIRRKALLEGASYFAGHSNYHGDTILCILKCMAEGKQVKSARPLNMHEIKSEAIKEFAERLKPLYMNDVRFYRKTKDIVEKDLRRIDNLVKEMAEGSK